MAEDLAQQRVEEEISCVQSIALCLMKSLVAATDPNLVAGEIIHTAELHEVLDVLVSLIEFTPNPFRIRVLLFEAQPYILHVLMKYITTDPDTIRLNPTKAMDRTSFESLQTVCVHALSRIVSVSGETYPDVAASYLIDPLLTHFAAENTLDIVLRFLSPGNAAATSVSIACAEFLYVMAVHIPQILQQIVDLNAVLYVFDILADPRNAHHVRNYAAAVARLVAEKYCDPFLEVAIFEKAAIVVRREEESKYLVTVVLELVTLLLNKHSEFYITKLRENIHSHILQNLSTACGLLCGSPEPDVVISSCNLFQCLFALESNCEYPLAHDFYTICLSNDSWKTLVLKESASKAIQMATFRIMVQFAFTRPSIDLLLERVVKCRVTLATILTLPQALSDDEQSKIIKLETSISVLLLMAKHPEARLIILETLQARPGWGEGFRVSVLQLLRTVQIDFFSNVPIVDVNGVCLNNVAYVMQLVKNWDDCVELIHVVVSMFRNQEATYLPKRAPSLESLAPGLAALWGTMPSRVLQGIEGSSMVSATHPVQRLTYAIFHCVLGLLALPPPPPASFAPRVVLPAATPPLPSEQPPSRTRTQTPRRVASAALNRFAPPSYPTGAYSMAANVRVPHGPPRGGTLAASKYVLRQSISGSLPPRRGQGTPPRRGAPFYSNRLYSPPSATREDNEDANGTQPSHSEAPHHQGPVTVSPGLGHRPLWR